MRRVLTVFTDVTAEFSGVVRPGDTVTIRARKVFFRRMKLRSEVEMKRPTERWWRPRRSPAWASRRARRDA